MLKIVQCSEDRFRFNLRRRAGIHQENPDKKGKINQSSLLKAYKLLAAEKSSPEAKSESFAVGAGAVKQNGGRIHRRSSLVFHFMLEVVKGFKV
jgi:hypothetical protein